MSAPEKTPAVNRKLLILLGAVAALALLAVFVVMPLLTSDPVEEVDLVAPPAAEGLDADAEAAPDPEADEDAGDPDAEDAEDGEVEETFEVFTARDPFKQLVVPAVEVAPDTTDGNTTEPTDPPTETDPPAPTDPEDEQTPEPPAEQKVEAYIVELVDVYEDDGEDKVQVTVNGTGYDVEVNERFADHFQLLSVDEDCATFLYGDNRFVLCMGDTILK